MMKILVYVPTSPYRPYIHKQTIDSIFDLKWTEPLQIVFDHQDIKGMRSIDVGGINNAQKLNRARDIVLNNNYNALLTIDSDMIVPAITLERLTRVKADVAYGLYVSRHPDHKWLAFTELNEISGRSFGESPELCQKSWGKVVETAGLGNGCTLIHRNVLEKISFHFFVGRKGAPDWHLSLDCQKEGFTQMHDLGVVCGHINPEGTEIYWPAKDGGYRTEN
jgi:hypothetical protein